MMEQVTSDKAPIAAGPYSHGIKVGGLIFTSGQLPVDRETGIMPRTIEEQTKKALDNVSAILVSAGSSKSKIVKTTVFLTDMADFGAMNLVYAEYFERPYPARSCVGVASLPKGSKIMIEAVASQN